MGDGQEQEQTISTELIYEGNIIRVEQLSVRLQNGRPSMREVVRHQGAVAVVAQSDAGKLVFVEQYRTAPGEVLLEIPAGKLESGEQPDGCARRELVEETGYTCRSMEPVFTFFTSPGFADEKLYLYFAQGLVPGPDNPDEDEFVNVVEYTRTELLDLLQDGQIRDAKTLVGVLWWLQRASDSRLHSSEATR